MAIGSRWSSEAKYNAFDRREKRPFAAAYSFRRQQFPHSSGGGGGNFGARSESSGDGALPYFVGSSPAQSVVPCSCQCPAWLWNGAAVCADLETVEQLCKISFPLERNLLLCAISVQATKNSIAD